MATPGEWRPTVRTCPLSGALPGRVPVTSAAAPGPGEARVAGAVEHQAADTSTPGMAEGGEEKQRCPLCPFASDSIDEMNKHVALHQAAQQQQQAAAAAAAAVAAACGMCTEAGKEPASVTLYGCGVCAKAFAIKEELDEHMQSHASRLFSCAVCGAIFVDKEHLEGHMRTHAPPEVFSYGGSDKLETKAVVRLHKAAEVGTTTHRCPLCPFATTSVNDFCKHVVLHAEGRANCTVCDKKEGVELEAPKPQGGPMAQPPSPQRCGVCGETFGDAASLQCHVRSCHTELPGSGTQLLWSCSFCGLVFSQKGQLDTHMAGHVAASERSAWPGPRTLEPSAKPKERPYTCPTCAKTFCQKAHLENHLRIHTGERPFSCTVCGKAFRRKEHIGRHMRIHTGERPFCCPHCGKRFSQKVHLESHVRIHTGERPFSCSACGKTFTRKEHIERHIKTHTGERMFVCSSCGKSFNQKAHLESHMRTHTGERPFNCSPCGKTFRQKVQLDRHSRTHAPQLLQLPPPQQQQQQAGCSEEQQQRVPLCIPGCPTCGKAFCCHLEPGLNIRNLLGEAAQQQQQQQQCSVQDPVAKATAAAGPL